MEANLALEYFKIGNGIAAFYVVQTLLFFHAIYKEKNLLSALCRKRLLASFFTWFIACIYIALISGCVALELWLRYTGNESINLIATALIAAIGRIGLIVTLAWICARFITKYLKDEPESA